MWKEVKKLWRIVYIEGPLYKQNGTHASVSDKRWAADGRVKVVLRKIMSLLEFEETQIEALFTQSESENPMEVVWLAVAKH